MKTYEIIVCDNREFDHAIVEMYRQHGYTLKEPEWIEWKYRRNPYGEPFIVIARLKGQIAGMQAHVPRQFYKGDQSFHTVEAVDAFVQPSYRRDGVYQHIWSKTKQIVCERNLVLTTFPSRNGQSIGVMRNVGLQTLGSLRTYANVLRPAALLKGKNLHTLGKLYKSLIEPFSKFNHRAPNFSANVREIKRFQESLVFECREIVGGRSPEYLNWKFFDNPMIESKCVVFSVSEKDVGYAAFRLDPKKYSLTIDDCVLNAEFSNCIESFTKYIWDNYPEVGVIFITELESGPLASALKKAGFFLKSTDQVLMLDNIDKLNLPLDPGQWLITRGDSDW